MIGSSVLIILAGGKSSRMGSPKGLLNFNNKPWILEQITRFKQTPQAKVYIGLGYDNDLYFKEIEWFKKAINDFHDFNGVAVKVVVNSSPEKGSYSTLQTVLKMIEPSKNALVLPIDVPLLNTKELQKVMAIKNLVTIPTYHGKNGHPVKLAPQFWNELLEINSRSEEARLDYQIKKVSESSISYISMLDSSITKNLNTSYIWNNYIKSCDVK
jgi:molybdopterin-guanine dinucleotide biosynthesis protein A